MNNKELKDGPELTVKIVFLLIKNDISIESRILAVLIIKQKSISETRFG